jgi:tetratricopeptide (TPR) repeat protein
MGSAREFPIRLRILLPLLVAFSFLIAPRNVGIQNDLEASRQAGFSKRADMQAIHLLSLVRWEPWRTGLWQQSGLLALLGGSPDLAITSLERAQQINGLDDSGRLALGEAFWTKSQKEQALETWEPLMANGKAPAEVFLRSIQYRRSVGNLKDALRLAANWSQAEPGNGAAAWNLGLLSLPAHWEQAGPALEKAASLDPSLAAQVKILTEAIGISGTDVPAEYRQVEIGRALGSLGEWNLALAAFERAKAINPSYAEAWAFSSEARRQLNQDGTANLKHALELAPDSPGIQALAAQDYRNMGDSQQALERFEAAAALEPQRALWWVEIGNTYADLHDNQKGLEYYQKAVSIEPQNPAIWSMLAQYCLTNMLELRATGLPAARQAALLAPHDPASQDLLGQVMLGLDDQVSSERFLQQAIDMDLDYPAAHLHLGQLYLRQERLDLAQYQLALAARQNGGDAETSLLARRLLIRYFGG